MVVVVVGGDVGGEIWVAGVGTGAMGAGGAALVTANDGAGMDVSGLWVFMESLLTVVLVVFFFDFLSRLVPTLLLAGLRSCMLGAFPELGGVTSLP